MIALFLLIGWITLISGMVAQERDLDINTRERWADGRIFIGTYAVGMGMNIDVPKPPVLSPALTTLKDLCRTIVCNNLRNGILSVETVRSKTPQDMREFIADGLKVPFDFKEKVISITPDHTYMLVKNNDPCLMHDRLNVFYRKCVAANMNGIVAIAFDESHIALSPFGNYVAWISSDILHVKDLQQDDLKQDKKIAEKKWSMPVKNINFIGEKNLLIQTINNHLRPISIEKNLEEGPIITFPYVGILHTTSEFITHTTNSFLRHGVNGKINQSIVFSPTHIIIRELNVGPAIDEPTMVMAYSQPEFDRVNIVSLEPQEIISLPLAQLSCGHSVKALSFAQKGQWLIVARQESAGASEINVWDWKKQQVLLTSMVAAPISKIFSTDEPTPFPCLLKAENGSLWHYDVMKIAELLKKDGEKPTLMEIDEK